MEKDAYNGHFQSTAKRQLGIGPMPNFNSFSVNGQARNPRHLLQRNKRKNKKVFFYLENVYFFWKQIGF